MVRGGVGGSEQSSTAPLLLCFSDMPCSLSCVLSDQIKFLNELHIGCLTAEATCNFSFHFYTVSSNRDAVKF